MPSQPSDHPLGVADSHGLAVSLAPALRSACTGRLSEIAWFRSAWQHGGAETGFATWTLGPGRVLDVVVKIPVGPLELRWTRTLGHAADSDWDQDHQFHRATPRVLACGDSLGGHDLGWFVVEKLAGKQGAVPPDRAGVEAILEALFRFHSEGIRTRPVDEKPKVEDWDALVTRAREAAHKDDVPEAQRWNEALKKTQRCLGALQARWDHRPINTWCHGDFHPGNILRRRKPDGSPGPCVLVDLALMHPGHWLEDALYLERLFWARPELLHGIKPASHLSQLRRDAGMKDDHVVELANTRRVLMAATAPAFMAGEGHPRYLHAALEVLEKTLPLVGHG
jgi:hypothetical protein